MNRLRGNRLFTLALMIPVLLCVLAIGSTCHAQETEPATSGDPAARGYFSANGLLNRGLNELAADEYRKFLAAHSDHEKADLARYGLGVALFRMKQYDKAAASLHEIVAKDDFQFAAEMQLVLGQCELAQQHYPEAAAAFQNVVEHHSDHASADAAAALLCESQYRAGQYKESRAACDQLIKRWPESTYRERAQFFSGLAAMAQQDFAGAAKILSDMRDRYPEGQFTQQSALMLAQSWHRAGDRDDAIRQYRQVIKSGKDDQVADATFGLATLLHAAGNDKEATELFDQFLTKFPNHQSISAALMERGRIAFDAGNFQDALTNFQKTHEFKGAPADEAAYWCAKCQIRMEKFSDAVATLDAALRSFPESKLKPEMSYDRAVALARNGKDAEAADALNQFRASFPEHALIPDALYLQATLEHNRKDYAASRALCDEFQKKAGQRGAPLRAAVDFLAAENDLLTDKVEPAIDEYRQFLAKYPDDSQARMARFRLGTALYRVQKMDDASEQLSKVVDGRKTPDVFRRALFMLGDIDFQQQRWSDAIAPFSDYLSFGTEQPFADDATLKLGLSQLRLNKSDEAAQLFQQVIEKFPQSVHRVQALFERGQIQLAQGDLDAASDSFQKTLQADAKSRFAPYAISHLASIAMQKQDYPHAAELYQQVKSDDAALTASSMFQRGVAFMAAGDLKNAADALEQFTRQFPNHDRVPEAQARRAISVARLADHDAAIALIEQAEKSADKLDPQLQATLKYEKAWCLRQLNRSDDAVTAYTQLIDSFPKQPLALNAMLELAELHTNAKRFDEAAALLTQLVDRTGSSSEPQAAIAEQALYRLLACKFELQQFADVSALGEQFMQRFPRSDVIASVHLFAGESLLKTNNPHEAGKHFAAIVQQFPSDPSAATSMLRLGECQAADQQWSESEQTFASFLKKYPDSELWFQAQFGIAWAKENQKQFDDAVAAYRKVIDRHNGPTAARSQFQIGECLYARKQYDDAVRELLKVDILYAYPEWSAAALYEAGRCFEELSKQVEARDQFQQVAQKFPGTKWAKLASERLSSNSGSAAAGQ